MDNVSPLPGEEALYQQMTALLVAADTQPEIEEAIINVVTELDNTLLKDFLKWTHNGKSAGNGWNRSVNNAQWGLDYFDRTGTSRSNMFDNRPNETQYFYTDNTSDAIKLSGDKNYEITFTELPPVKGFWSVTLYNEDHFFHANELKRYSLGTKNQSLKYNDNDGSLTLYAGNEDPGGYKRNNWIPAPEGDFSLYIRAYWGKEGITEGIWQPPVITKIN